MFKNQRLLAGCLLLAWLLPVAAEDLALQFPNGAGPAPVRADAARLKVHGGARPYLQLGPAAPNAVAAAWAAGPLLNNAQGAVSFFVRVPTTVRADAHATPLLRLTATGGGTWTISVKNQEYVRREKLKTAKEELAAAGTDLAGGAKPPPEEGDLTEPPTCTLVVDVAFNYFVEGHATGNLAGQRDFVAKDGWHHVLWTWRSIEHALFLDGQPVASLRGLSRLAPIVAPEAALELLAADVALADLRVYRRALPPEAAAVLAQAGPKDAVTAPPPFRLWADWAFSTGRTVVYADAGAVPGAAQVALRCVAAKTGEAVKEVTIDHLPNGLGEQVVKVYEPDPFPVGTWRFEGVVLDGQGRELARATSAEWTNPARDWPWIGFRGGLDPKVRIIPPYTAIRQQDRVLSTVTTDYSLGADGLVTQVTSAGAPLLAGPVELRVTSAGQVLAFGGGPGFTRLANQETAADWVGETVAAPGHALRIAGHLEYDGVVRFDLTLTPHQQLAVDAAELRIPYRPELVRLFYSKASDFGWRFLEIKRRDQGAWGYDRINWMIGHVEKKNHRPGVIYDSDEDHIAGFDRFAYTPYALVGNYERGLSWYVENDRDWVHDYGHVPPLELVVTDQEKYLRLNVIARPVTLNAPWQLRFYLLANPYKPLPKDWRTWAIGVNQNTSNGVNRNTKYRFWWHWNEYAESFKPYPGLGVPGQAAPKDEGTHDLANTKRYADWVGAFTKPDEPLRHTPFINFGVPGGLEIYAWPENRVEPYNWKLHTNRGVQDYMCYWLDRCAREVGIKGVYIDEPYAEVCSYNVLADDAPYLRADGTRGLGYRFAEGRTYVRRLKQLFTDLGIDYSIWLHTTNYRVQPVYTFGDISMDGEHPQIWVPKFSDYHGFYNPIHSRGFICGIPFGLVGTMMYHGNTDPLDFPSIYQKSRSYLAVTLPYGVLPMGTGLPYEHDRIQNIRDAFGIGDEGLTELPMEQEAQWLGRRFEPDGLVVSGTVNAARHRALIYCSPLARSRRYILPGGFGRLALGQPHNHAWDAETGASLLVGDQAALDVVPGHFAGLWVQGAGQPQRPRPDGAVLGVSFDAGVGPDFGDGLQPTVAAGPEPRLVPGRVGQALALGGGRSVAYPVVPSWRQGTVEVEVQLLPGAPAALTLLRLAQHLDLSLALERRGPDVGLRLRTLEVPPGKDPAKVSYRGSPAPDATEYAKLFPLPADQRLGGHHLTLTWEAGKYDLYWDGRALGNLHQPALPRLRDAAFPRAGVILGDEAEGAAGAPAAAVDSLLVYDWPLRPADAASVTQRPALQPAPRPAPAPTLATHAWVRDKENLTVWASFVGRTDWADVSAVRIQVRNRKAPDQVLANQTVSHWLGTVLAYVFVNPGQQRQGPEALTGEQAAGADEGEVSWLVRVELLQGSGKDEKVLGTREETVNVDLLDLD